MLRNYLKIAFRNLTRNKLYSSINIFGLAAGLAVCLLIMLYIFDELSYDKHQKDGDRIYRLAYISNSGETWSAQPAPVAFTLKAESAEAEQVTRLLKVPDLDKILLQYEQEPNTKKFFEPNGYYVDSTFFQIFTYDFTYGNATSALSKPNSIVLSESVAAKMFGQENPIGKAVKLQLPFGNSVYTVRAVFKENYKSHIPAHFFMSMQNSDVGAWVNSQQSWATNNIFHTYVKLKSGTDPKVFEKRMIAFMDRHEGAELKAAGYSKHQFIQRMPDIYLHSSLGNEIAPNGNIRYLYIMGSIAAFILVIACINFMNLSTAKASKRLKEVGIKKVMGANRSSLVLQYIGESLLMAFVSLCFALLIVVLLLPEFRQITGKEINLHFNSAIITAAISIALITGIIAGSYPAFYLSSFKPVKVLKGTFKAGRFAAIPRKVLVVLQFTVSVSLIIATIIVYQQIQFAKNRPVGYSRENLVSITTADSSIHTHFEAVKAELMHTGMVTSVAETQSPVTDIYGSTSGFSWPGKDPNLSIDFKFINASVDYGKTIQWQIKEGRDFSKDFATDTSAVIINEAAAHYMQLKNPVGTKVTWFDQPLTIIGVADNMIMGSPYDDVDPTIYTEATGQGNFLLVKLSPNASAKNALTQIETIFKKYDTDEPFEYHFTDEEYAKKFDNEERVGKLANIFAILAIIISCLGLFGLTSFVAEQRKKEIGVRKVLGASVFSVWNLLSKDFVTLVIISFIIAVPLSYYFMHNWLQNYSYRTTLSWWIFIAAGVGAIVITLITVSFQAIKAAIANPVKSLRTE